MSQQNNSDQTELFPMSSPAGSPAKISQSQATKREWVKAQGRASGQSAPVYLGKFDPITQSLKTSQHSFLETQGDGFSEFSGTYPRSGMMRNGTVYQLPNLARTITEIGSGLLHTPTCNDAKNSTLPPEQDQLSRKCNEGSESPSPCGDVAYPNSSQREGGGVSSGVQAKHAISHSKGGAGATSKIMADTAGIGQQKQGKYEQSIFAEAYREGKTANALTGGSPDIWKVEPELGRVADGIRDRSHRLKGLGNAVVPQIPELIGRAILEAENEAM
jgi:hypothetical protein